MYSITTTRYNAAGKPLISMQKQLISQLSPTLESKSIFVSERGLTSTQWSEYSAGTKRLQYSTVPSSAITAETVTVTPYIYNQMKIIYAIFAFVIITILFPTSCEHYSHDSFRWVNVANSIFSYQRIWYQDKLILETGNPEVKIDLSLQENGIIAAQITVKNGYPSSFWYRYYSIADETWMKGLTGEYACNVPCTQFLSLYALEHSLFNRSEFESMLNKTNKIKICRKTLHPNKEPVLKL